MPIRSVITDTPVFSQPFGPNNARAEGRRWKVQPLLPIPDDATSQASAFIDLNKDKEENVAAWLGIKYAAAPIGARRFKAAVPYEHPGGSFNAYTPPLVPWQRYFEELDDNGRPEFGDRFSGAYDWIDRKTRESEDILTLNIWAPEGLTNRPVIFHIHGGAWTVYHAMAPQQLGHRMAAHKGCVVVTVEYRLSTFGHFAHPDLLSAGEPSAAYTDIKTALEWVHDNIASFGGDPSKICVSGTSAGGAAVQLLLEDDDTLPWIKAAWIGSGGGSAPYLAADYYKQRAMLFERSLLGLADELYSVDRNYEDLGDAIDTQGFAWAAQHALWFKDVQALADRRRIVTKASLRAALKGTGSLQTTSVASDNVYPFRRGTYVNAMEAAKGGEFRRPFVSLFAECEALNLLGSDYVTVRDGLLALSDETLNGWAQRLGYADYDAWRAGAWMPVGGLEALSSAQFKTSIDPLAVDCENRRVLYTHAVFAYPAWRVARAAAETGSASAWLVCNNFSANSIWAGHSQEVALMLGNIEWLVAGGGERPSATVPGYYVNNRMDAFYVSEFMMQALATLAATGDPNGAYSYTGFNLFSDSATHPADGGAFTAAWTAYTLAQPGHANVVGKYFDPINNLNAGTFVDGDIVAGLDLHRDAKVTYAEYMGDAFLEYLSLLEP